MPRRDALGAGEARRIALAAQGFGGPPLKRAPDVRALRTRVIARVGVLQIDSVNVLERAHYLPAFSRLGAYERAALDRLSQRRPRRLFEYWAHEASLVPVELHPLLRWRMDRVEREGWGSMRRVAQRRPDLLETLLAELRDRGPLTARQLGHLDEADGPKGPWWDWSDVKAALEYLFFTGAVTSARRERFERVYDLPERVLPREVLSVPTPAVADAQRELVRVAARAFGVATEQDLRDYFRLPAGDAKQRVAELVEDGALAPVAVEGWRGPAYLEPAARVPRSVEARALVGPFDSLIWHRPRTERLFGFRYRLEIYVPRPRRVYGYYVVPFLLGDRLVARVDLKSDRAARKLLVQSAHAEPAAPPETAEALAAALGDLSAWLGLDGVVVQASGDLAAPLGARFRGRVRHASAVPSTASPRS